MLAFFVNIFLYPNIYYRATIYKYEIKENVYDSDGSIQKVIGVHKQVNKMSPELLARLKYGGASEEMLRCFM